MGRWITISNGSGSYVPPPNAPNVTFAGVPSVTLSKNGHGYDPILTFILNLPTTDAAYPHLREIDVIAVDASGKKLPPDLIPSSIFSGTTITDKIVLPLVTDYKPNTWTLTAYCANDLGIRSAGPATATVAVTPPVVLSATASETGPRFVQNTGRALATTVTVTPTLSYNPGGTTGLQAVTIYETHDWGDGQGPRTTWKGWKDVTGVSSAILLAGDDAFFVTLLASALVTIQVAIGAIDKEDPIPTTPTPATATFTMAGPASPPAAGNWISGANFTGLSSQLKYFSTGGGNYVFKAGTLVYNAGFSTHPTLKSTRCMAQNGNWNGSVWTPATTDGADRPFADGQITKTDPNTIIVVTGDSVSVTVTVYWSVWPSTYAFPHVRVHIDGLGTVDGVQVTQAAFAGQVSPCSEITFSPDGQYAYIQPSFAKAQLTAAPWDPATLGNRLGISGGLLGVSTPAAPAVTGITATVNFVTIGGLPKWNASGLVTLPATHAQIAALHFKVPGLPELFTIPGPFTPNGSNQIPYQTNDQPRDTVTFNYTLSCWTENFDSQQAAPTPAGQIAITVTGTAAPFTSSAGPPVNISVASATVHYVANGHGWDFYPSGQFTAPSDPTHNNAYVRVTLTNASGGTVDSIVMDGPFAGGTSYPFANMTPLPIPAAHETWHVNYLPVNGDSLAGTAFAVSIDVGPNLITQVNGAEGLRFTEPGGGAKSHVSIAAAINPANSPGYPQTVTYYFSADSGATWFGMDWVDATASGIFYTFEVWRPLVADRTCKTACAIGAYNFPIGQFTDSGPNPTPTGPLTAAQLPAGTIISTATFPLVKVGAPLSTGVTNAQVLPRPSGTPAGNIYNGVTLEKNQQNVVYFRIIPGISWVNPTSDPDFFYSVLAVISVDNSGNADPQDFFTEHSGPNKDQLSATVTTTEIDGWDYLPTTDPRSTTYQRLRLVVRNYSRSGQFSVQNCWTGTPPNTGITYGGTFCDVTYGPPPSDAVIANVSLIAGTGISIGAGNQINVKLAGAITNLLTNGNFASSTPNGGPNAAPGWDPILGIEFGPEATPNFGRSADGIYFRLNSSGSNGPSTGIKTNAGSLPPASAGLSYTFNIYFTNLNGVATSNTAFAQITWLNSSLSQIGSPVSGTLLTSAACLTTSPTPPINWQQASVVATAPAGAAFARVAAQCSATNSTTGFWYADDAIFGITPGTPGPMGLDSNGAVTINIVGPIYSDVANAGALNLKIAPDFVVSAGQLNQSFVNLAKSVGFDSTIFGGGGGSNLTINSLAVNKLAAGDALFAGTATFAFNGGGKVTINSLGVTIANSNISPTSTVTIASGGITVQSPTSSVVVSNGILLTGASGNSVSITASGAVFTSGSNSVTVSASNIILNKAGTTLTVAANSISIFDGLHSTATIQTNVNNGIQISNLSIANPLNVSALFISQVSTGAPALNLTLGFVATSASPGGSSALPGAPAGYMPIAINNTTFKIPYWNF